MATSLSRLTLEPIRKLTTKDTKGTKEKKADEYRAKFGFYGRQTGLMALAPAGVWVTCLTFVPSTSMT